MEPAMNKFSKVNAWFAALAGLLFLVFPYWSGLFFPVAIVNSTIYIGFLILAMSLVAHFRKTEVKGFIALDVLVLLYTVVNLLTVFTSSHLEFTLTGIAEQFAYLAFYLLARVMLSAVTGLRIVMAIVALSGTGYSLYGLLGLWGVFDRPGLIMKLGDGVKRISSAFEYPNAFASFVAVALVFGLILQSMTKRRYVQVLWMIANAISLSGVILTYSRGAWLTLPGTIVLLIIFAQKGTRTGISFNALGVFVSSLAAVPFFASAAEYATVGQGIIGLLTAAALGAALSFAVQWLTRRTEGMTVSAKVIIPAIVVLLAAPFGAYKLGLLPNAVAERVSTISLNTFSVQQRLVFYQDGMKALKDHPLIGAGDRTWEAMFHKYQSYPYYTTSSHSVLVDQLMNVGLIGTLLFVVIISLTAMNLWKLRKQGDGMLALLAAALLAGFAELVLHGMIDVDFNYAIIGYLFWMLVAFGAMVRPLEIRSVTAINAWKWEPQNRWFWWTLLPFSLVMMLYGGSYVYANLQLDQATSQLGAPAVALQHVDAANRVAPYLTDLKMTEGSLYQRYYERNGDPVIQALVQKAYQELAEISPDNALLLMTAGQKLVEQGKPLEGTAMIQRAWQNAPYRAEIAEQYMVFSTQIGEALQKEQKDRAKVYFQGTINAYQEVQRRVEGFKDLPSLLKLERPYAITTSMSLHSAESALLTGQYELADQWAGAALKDKQLKADKKAILNAIKALALEKQGKADAKLLKDASVKKQYDRLKSLL